MSLPVQADMSLPTSHRPSLNHKGKPEISSMNRRDLIRQIGQGSATLVAGALLISQDATAQEPGIVGRKAPQPQSEFWIDAHGQPTQFNMQQQAGKWVHLKFWQSWCPGCHAHGFPALQAFSAAFAKEPRVVTVALQTVFEGFWSNTAGKVRSTQQRYQLPIIFGHDPASNKSGAGTMQLYRSGGTPWHVIVNPQGVVVFNGFQINTEAAISHIKAQLALKSAS
jgi:thiol-disulfide isomerase/thioredoxin